MIYKYYRFVLMTTATASACVVYLPRLPPSRNFLSPWYPCKHNSLPSKGKEILSPLQLVSRRPWQYLLTLIRTHTWWWNRIQVYSIRIVSSYGECSRCEGSDETNEMKRNDSVSSYRKPAFTLHPKQVIRVVKGQRASVTNVRTIIGEQSLSLEK